MSHYSPGDRMLASQKRDAAQSELLAGLIDKLKAVKELDGRSLFEHTCLVYGSMLTAAQKCSARRGKSVALDWDDFLLFASGFLSSARGANSGLMCGSADRF
jgi:hypothetical protein